MLQIVNKDTFKTFTLEFSEGNKLSIDGKCFDYDIKETGINKQHLLLNQGSYEGELLEIAQKEKIVKIKFKGRIISFAIKEEFDLLFEKLGTGEKVKSEKLSIKAPIPGLIINVVCKHNDFIKKGDTILILEAMKMENIIKSPYEGLVSKIHVKKGDKVEKGQVLVEIF